MKNLTTRKIVLGLLVGLVLALGVQGTADALTFGTSRSGDLVTVSPNQPFTIKFSVNLKSPVAENPSTSTGNATDIAYASGDRTRAGDPNPITNNFSVTVDTGYTAGDTHYYTVTTTSTVSRTSPLTGDVTRTTYTRNWLTESEAYDYNDESVLITSTPTLMQGSTAVTGLVERHEESDRRLSGSVTLTGSHATAGVYDIIITDNTVAADFPDDTAPTTRASITFTIFVVEGGTGNTDSDEWGFTGLTNGYRSSIYADLPITTASTSAHIRVKYEVVEGSGRLYVQRGNNRKTSATRMISTSSAAVVYLDESNSTNKVRAIIAGAPAETGLFIYGEPNVEITGGNPQTGIVGQRLEDALVVRVRDGRNRTISGLPVDFDTAASGAMFIPVPGTTVYVDASGVLVDAIADGTVPKIATSTSPSPFADIIVQTDSRGEAKTYFQLGGTSGTQTVSVLAGGYRPVDPGSFSFEAIASTGRGPILSILSGDNQRTDADGEIENPLVVVVRQGRVGQIKALKPGEKVTFGTSKGTLTGYGLEADGTVGTTRLTGKRVYVATDANGQAEVTYYQSPDSGRDTVTARIEGTTPVVYEGEVIFNINGSGGGGGDGRDDGSPPVSQTPRLTIGATGTGTERSVTVTATNAQGAVVPGLFVTLSGTALPDGSQNVRAGEATSITLPSTPATYTLTAIATGYTSDTETFTIEAPGTLAITAVGARSGTQQQITVTASGRTIPSGGLVVTLQGVTNPRTVTIQSGSTSVSRIATLPSASSPHTVTATAVGYNDSPPLTIPAPGQQPPTRPQPGDTSQPQPTGPAGVADSIEIDGDRQRSGTVNQVLRLRARVLDANDNGVSGVRVTFRVLAPGQGRLSQRGNGRATQVETDRSGYATASLTPLGGDLIVEAKAAQVTAPVTFIIVVGGGTGGTETDTDATASTPSPQTYNVGDKVPISLEGTLSFTNPRTLGGITYTCVGDGECVVSYGLVTKGQIQAAPAAKTTPPRAYQVGDKIPISLEDTLTFTGKHTVNGTSYTCVGDGECVVSYGLVTKGQIEVTTATAATPHTSEIMPEVLLGADRRPPMVWVDGGKLYALVGAAVHAFAPAVENVMNIAVSGDMLYWTQMTGKNAGTINAMHLDGTGAKELVSIHAVPRGIAVDSVAKRLYWTNSQGWIQSSNLEGTARRNVISGGLEDPLGIRVGNGWLYWTQGDGRLQAVNLTGTQAVRTLATGMQSAEGLSVFENKVYWTQMTGRNAGTINAVNLDGTGAKALVSIQAVPRGIVVDGVAKRLYWTNSQGWIQSSNLEGTARRNVAKGLGSPGGIALSATLEVSAMAATQKDAASPTAAAPNYDVDGSGTVDNADLFLVSLAVGTDNAQYDVNGDGTVNDKDIALVRDNRDNGAAAAPMVFGVKLTAEQVGRLQEQIDLLIVSGDRSPDALKTLVYLQQLIATARPEQTQLLANYPNPFNPETWIPYELATDTDVRITIYAANGVVVRTLQLGQQSAGYYTDRERAAYWDGRNASGETVASGVYFYQLETDTISSLRKMVILK